MSTQIKVAEQWMDGFVKAAEAVGLTQEQAGELFKLSARLQARSTNPAAFDAGYDEVMAKAADHTGQLVKTGGLGAILGLLTAGVGGGLAMLGGRHVVNRLGERVEMSRMLNDWNRAQRLRAKHQTYANLFGNAPGVNGGGNAPSVGVPSYGGYRSPYALP